MLIRSQVKFYSPQNISGASLQNILLNNWSKWELVGKKKKKKTVLRHNPSLWKHRDLNLIWKDDHKTLFLTEIFTLAAKLKA